MSEYAARLRQQIEREEGRRTCVYKDSEGWDTIGIGRLVDSRKPGAGLSDDEIEYLFANDVKRFEDQLSARLPWLSGVDDARRAAIVNMGFQLGVDGLMAFKRMLAAARDQSWAEAETHALDSVWAKQTPARARRVARQLATGEWQ